MAASVNVARVGGEVVSVPACPVCRAALAPRPGVASGYCPSCGAAWLLCLSCHEPVSTLIRHCPRDARRVDLSASPVNDGRDLRVVSGPGHRFDLHERFVHAPREYAGYLWMLSQNGNLYRFAPPARRELVENLGGEYGVGPFEVVNRGASARTLIAVATRDTIAVLDPAVHEARDEPERSPRVGAGGRGGRKTRRYFVNVADGASPAMAHASGSFAALVADGAQTGLAVWAPGAAPKIWPLHAEALHGPFALGSLLCACSRTHLHWFDGTSIRKMPLPPRFEPIDPRTTTQYVRPPWGRPAFIHTADGVYIGGHVGTRPGFLFAELAGDGPAIALAATDTLRGGESYRLMPDGHVVVAGRSGLHVMTRTTLRRPPVDVPGELQSAPAVIVGRSYAGLFRGTVGTLEIRVYPDGTRLEIPAGHELVDLYVLPGHLAAALVSLADHALTIITWPLAS